MSAGLNLLLLGKPEVVKANCRRLINVAPNGLPIVLPDMRARLFILMQDLRASYWFIPSVMALLAIALGAIMVWLDAGPAVGVLDGLGWYQKAKPDGAHEVLSTIAGSMITVAGVVFSITIVAIAYAASQYGPRILTNFMGDRGNQVTLGTFIATFVYCLVVLRTIRGGDEGQFVPQLAVMVGLFLALCSIAVLIFFIHHVPRSIHINNVVARIGRQLIRSIEQRFPSGIGGQEDKDAERTGDTITEKRVTSGNAIPIPSPADGYIEGLDEDTLMRAACTKGLTLQLQRRPGDFVLKEQALMSAWPAEKIGCETKRILQASYSIGNLRTPAQDMFFLVDELVEIAARALSTGVNDPYTAMTCQDWLAAASAELCGKPNPPSQRFDQNGVVRVIVEPDDFAGFIDRGFGRMRQYVARDMNAAAHAFDSLATVAHQGVNAGHLETLGDEARRLLVLVEGELRGPSLAKVREHFDRAELALATQ